MIVTIHQPEHMPYFGLLDKINKSDIFVVLDDVQFKKNNFQNRNQILTKNGPKWLNIPVQMKNLENKDINHRKVSPDWKSTYRNKVVEAYGKYPYFEENIIWIDEMLDISSELLIDYNMFIIEKLMDLLEIDTKVVYSSTLDVETFKTQRLYDICKKLDATAYLAGQGAIDYLDKEIFKGIDILEHHFKHPVYEQQNSPEQFYPYMSSLDIIMSIGKEAFIQKLKETKSA
eukprot:Anaeramoba_ignava/c3235_g1_i2.p1 GENE.c3235_g1_i2~~c3235_g1_i2.p1  ORF type:complete len:230 (+),score=22.71 c3235_g1_i2:355-1044(+)